VVAKAIAPCNALHAGAHGFVVGLGLSGHARHRFRHIRGALDGDPTLDAGQDFIQINGHIHTGSLDIGLSGYDRYPFEA
jgi:hypothetical protein